MGSDITKRIREWHDRCTSAIRQGGSRLERELSDKAGENAPSFLWASLCRTVSLRTRKPKKISELTRTILSHPYFQTPQKEHCSFALRSIIEEAHTFAAIPLLHEAGFCLTESEADFDIVAACVSKGLWPHVEIVAPTIFQKREHYRELVNGMSSRDLLFRPDQLSGIGALAWGKGFQGHMNRALALDLPDILSKISLHEKSALIKTLSLYHEYGVMDLAGVMDFHNQYFHEDICGLKEVLASAQRSQISRHTPKVSGQVRARRI